MRLEFGPWGWDLDPEVGIWASRLGFGPRGFGKGFTKEKEEKEKEEKIPHICESLGHRPLRGRCPKGGNVCNLCIDIMLLTLFMMDFNSNRKVK